jgi:carbon-monoxide dehydrogenase large subunit
LRVLPVFTNKTPTTPLRGAGRPQAVFTMERLMDRVAQATGLDRAEVRRRNFVQPEEMPYKLGLIYRDGSPVTYDSGDYPRCQAEALEKISYATFPERQAKARSEGRYIGIGIGNYVEGTGLGPYEGAVVRVLPSGKISVASGAAPQGQGHVTTLAQIAADAFGVAIDDVEVTVADTAAIPIGIGTFASRITVNAGSSVHRASLALRERVFKLASHLLEAGEEDLEIKGREVRIKGVPQGVTLSRLRQVANGMPGFTMPVGLEPGLEVSDYFTPRQATYCNGTHVVEVEVDPETGRVDITRYVVAHDSGRIINPMIVDGQVQGGVAHGVGNALLEVMRYDDEAQPQSMTFADYLLPMAPNVPMSRSSTSKPCRRSTRWA